MLNIAQRSLELMVRARRDVARALVCARSEHAGILADRNYSAEYLTGNLKVNPADYNSIAGGHLVQGNRMSRRVRWTDCCTHQVSVNGDFRMPRLLDRQWRRF